MRVESARLAALFCLVVASGCEAVTPGVAEEDVQGVPVATACPTTGPGISWGGDDLSRPDTRTDPERVVVLMGGGPEVDSASIQFVQAAAGGDIRILRATGSVSSYPAYFSTGLNADPAPASVSTIRTDLPSATTDPSVGCQLDRAEAVWLAGGNQADYVFGWTADVHGRLTDAGQARAIGGTSAGAMVLGEVAFNAEWGSVDSEAVLADPGAEAVSVDPSPLGQPELQGMIVDTHFSQRNREGRLLGFMARSREFVAQDQIIGIGLDERAALVIAADSFRVLALQDARVHMYVLRAGPTPGSGPLNLALVRRVSLGHDYIGIWPPDLETMAFDTLSVREGVILNQ